MTALLDVNAVVKHFPIAGSRKVVQAVNGISFEIQAGETLGLGGESGSGKTTVGRCIVGLNAIDGGSIRLNGRHITFRSERAKMLGEIQIVFQESAEAFDPRKAMRASLEEPLTVLPLTAAERRARVDEVTERVGLSRRLLGLPPTDLSGGQLQRFGIARALVTRPKLLVLDEPTSALDPTARAEIIALLMRLQQESAIACLFISHDLSTVRHVSHRVAVMYLGMIVEQGPASEVFSNPRHPYSVGLLSSVLLPNPDIRRTASVDLAGEIPSPIDLPDGCFLASRCPFAIAACRAAMPPAVQVSPGHEVHCIRHEEVGRRERVADAFTEFERETERILGKDMPQHAA